jgi:murein DD-endopeptidase MepM/ murein hydrolase activator NlpD
MLFRKYHVVVFKDGVGQCRKLKLGGWMPVLIAVLLVVLGGANVYLWKYYRDFGIVASKLGDSEKTVNEQKTQLLSLASKMKILEKDLGRISAFDSKLRVMLNAETGQAQPQSPIGGPENNDFTKSYLTLYRQELLARKMHSFLEELSTEARLEEVQQQELVQNLLVKQETLATTPSIWPAEGWVSSPFGYRVSPFTGKRELHRGIDISGPVGTPIYSPAKGSVVFADRDGAYGLSVCIDHGGGVVTRYAHLHKFAVKSGQAVARGELIGYIGNTGRSTGPHLHYEVSLNGLPVNPLRYILN